MPQRIGSLRWFVFVLFLWSLSLIAVGCAPGEKEATATPEMEPSFVDEGTPSPSMETPTAQAMMAPDFTLRDLEGREVSLSQFRGRPVMLFFWATW